MACTLTHAQHIATWTSWQDDCTDPDGCGFAMLDPDQCDRGHPDDGITWCGACGHLDPAEQAALERRTADTARPSREVPSPDMSEVNPLQEVIIISWPFSPETHAEENA